MPYEKQETPITKNAAAPAVETTAKTTAESPVAYPAQKPGWKKTAARVLLQMLVCTALVTALLTFKDGLYLPGVPDPQDVQQVVVAYPAVAEAPKVVTDAENIVLAVKLTGFLRYTLFEQADEAVAPAVTITYVLRSGESVTVAANDTTVWWHGTAHAIRDKGTFINLAKGLFFLQETKP